MREQQNGEAFKWSDLPSILMSLFLIMIACIAFYFFFMTDEERATVNSYLSMAHGYYNAVSNAQIIPPPATTNGGDRGGGMVGTVVVVIIGIGAASALRRWASGKRLLDATVDKAEHPAQGKAKLSPRQPRRKSVIGSGMGEFLE